MKALLVAVALVGCASSAPPDPSDDDASGASGGMGGAGGICEADIMKDPANCGSCGHDCEGGPCVGGSCGPVQIASDGSYVMALDTAAMYYDAAPGLSRVPVGGSAVELIAPDLSISSLVVDATHAFVTQCGGGLTSVELASGDVAVLSTTGGGCGGTQGMAQNNTTVFMKTADAVVAVPKSGGAPATLVQHPYNVQGVAVDATRIYFGSGGVWSAPLAGGGATSQLAPPPTPQASAHDVAVDATHIYVAFPNAGLYRGTKSVPTALEQIHDSYARRIWLSQSHVYWGNPEGVFRISTDTLEVEMLAAGDVKTAVGDGARVFWIDTAGRVYKQVL